MNAAGGGWSSMRSKSASTFSSSTHGIGSLLAFAVAKRRNTCFTRPVEDPVMPARSPARETSTHGKPATKSSVDGGNDEIAQTSWANVTPGNCCFRTCNRPEPSVSEQSLCPAVPARGEAWCVTG